MKIEVSLKKGAFMNPANVYALINTTYDSPDMYILKTVRGKIELQHKDWQPEDILESVGGYCKIVKLPNGAELTWEFFTDIVKILSTMYGCSKREVLNNIDWYASDDPEALVGIKYRDTLAVIAPRIKEEVE